MKYIKHKISIISKISYQYLRNNNSVVLACILLGLSHFLFQGYTFGDGNHSIQIPFLKRYFHPGLYPNDPMIETRSHYITFYFIFLAVLDLIFGHLEFIFFIAQLITEILIFITIYHLAYSVFKERNAAIISVILVFTNKPILGGEIIQWNYHTHTYAVLPFIFIAFTLFLTGRCRKAYALLGFAANINIQSVTYTFPMFALVSFIDFIQNKKFNGLRNGLLSLLKDYGIFMIFGLPVFIWAFSTAGGPLTLEWMAQLYLRSKHHTSPLSWDVKEYITYLLFFTIGILFWLTAIKNSEDRKIHYSFGYFTVIVLVFCAVAVIFSEFVPVKLVLRSQLFRSTRFLTIFILLYSGYAIKYLWNRNLIGKILGISIFLSLFFPEYLKFLVILLLIYQFLESKKLYWVAMVLVASVIILRVHVSHEALPAKVKWEEINSFINPFFEDKIKATILTLLIFWLAIKSQSKKWLTYSSAIVIMLVLIIYVLPEIHKKSILPYEKRSNWVKTQLWIKENTPLDALFITPPYLLGFRVFSERSTVVEWKDGTQQFFKPEYSYIWWDRSEDMGDEKKENYDNKSTERLVRLCKKYGASYIVFPAAKTLKLPHVYENKDFRIYKCVYTKADVYGTNGGL